MIRRWSVAKGGPALWALAYRATDPKVMRAMSDPVGPANDKAIAESVAWADMVVCAWGNHGLHLGRGAAVTDILRRAGVPLWHFGLTGHNQPRHPLYVGYDQQPMLW